jgi:hypothetical protein
MEWINTKDKKPSHMQEVKVWIDNPFFGSFERQDNAVFLRFEEEGEFYDSEEQIHLDYVTKWRPLPSIAHGEVKE